jgi:plasmid stabilization system protein ParE
VDYRLLYTQKALNDLAEIVGHIADDDAEASYRFANSLLDHLDLLTRFPRMGSSIRKRARVRKLVHSPILVYYQVREDQGLIEILHLRHGSRKPPRGLLF